VEIPGMVSYEQWNFGRALSGIEGEARHSQRASILCIAIGRHEWVTVAFRNIPGTKIAERASATRSRCFRLC
jgi:hypothetical protein